MSSVEIFELERIEALYAPREWRFARERAAEIAANWQRLTADNPALYDGRVLLQYQRHLENGVLHARYLETDYKAFLACRDFGWPDKEVRNGFSMAALRTADGAFLLGEMAAHTANPGRVYFAAGTPDPSDITPDGRVDLLGSLLRELEEEMEIKPSEISVADRWIVVTEAQRSAFMRQAVIALEAEAARSLVLSRLQAQARPELADVHIVRSTADIDAATMPLFTCAYLEHAFAR